MAMIAAGALEAQYTEPRLDPAAAREWLLDSARAIDENGTLRSLDHNDHLGEAGLRIAMGDEPQYLTEAYADVKANEPDCSLNVVRRIAQGILEQYQAN